MEDWRGATALTSCINFTPKIAMPSMMATELISCLNAGVARLRCTDAVTSMQSEYTRCRCLLSIELKQYWTEFNNASDKLTEGQVQYRIGVFIGRAVVRWYYRGSAQQFVSRDTETGVKNNDDCWRWRRTGIQWQVDLSDCHSSGLVFFRSRSGHCKRPSVGIYASAKRRLSIATYAGLLTYRSNDVLCKLKRRRTMLRSRMINYLLTTWMLTVISIKLIGNIRWEGFRRSGKKPMYRQRPSSLACSLNQVTWAESRDHRSPFIISSSHVAGRQLDNGFSCVTMQSSII